MQVARLYDFGDIRVEESARPVVGDGDILVRASACGICSGDIMPWYIKRKAPLVLGHEPVGVVEQAGAGVRGGWRMARITGSRRTSASTLHQTAPRVAALTRGIQRNPAHTTRAAAAACQKVFRKLSSTGLIGLIGLILPPR